MKEKELEEYLGTLKLAQESIGFSKANRKHLFRLEMLKKLVIDSYEDAIGQEFIKETGIEEFKALLGRNPEIKKIWDRDNPHLCYVPGRPKLKYDDVKVFWMNQKRYRNHENTEAPDDVSLAATHVKSLQETGQETRRQNYTTTI